jgi:hypothetical protein
MLKIIPFLSVPVGYVIQAYKEANFELPLHKGIFSERVYKSDPEYNALVKILPGSHIKKEILPFLEKKKVREDLIVVETVNIGVCSAKGTNMFRKGDAALLLAPGLHAKDKEACHWIMKHEINHIKKNDLFIAFLVGSVCSTAAAVFGTVTMPWLSTILLTGSVGMTAFSLFSQWRESKADDFAIENSSDQELLGGRRILMASQQMNLSKRQTFWGKIRVSSYGNDRFDIIHPSLTSRLEKIEKILGERKIPINEKEEHQKIENLKLFIIKKTAEIKRKVANEGGVLGIMKRMLTM